MSLALRRRILFKQALKYLRWLHQGISSCNVLQLLCGLNALLFQVLHSAQQIAAPDCYSCVRSSLRLRSR